MPLHINTAKFLPEKIEKNILNISSGYFNRPDLKKINGVKFVKIWISGVKKLMFCYFFLLTNSCFS
jgi:hypothetical protein